MIRRRYRCPMHNCGHEFNYDHHPSIEADPCPRFCAKCGHDSESDELLPAVTSPVIRSLHSKVVDQTYRDMEAGAEHRAQMAMEVHGLDQQEANSLKITNLQDNLQPGDMAAMPVNNPVSAAMAQQPGRFGYQGGAAMEHAAAAHTGPHANAGARAMQGLRAAHQSSMMGAGNAGATSSDMPALETQQPNYRRRV